jgi:hypothetical protein
MDVGRVLCRVFLHKWVVKRPGRGADPYMGCARCGKERMVDLGPGAMLGGAEGRIVGDLHRDQ